MALKQANMHEIESDPNFDAPNNNLMEKCRTPPYNQLT